MQREPPCRSSSLARHLLKTTTPQRLARSGPGAKAEAVTQPLLAAGLAGALRPLWARSATLNPAEKRVVNNILMSLGMRKPRLQAGLYLW